MANMISKMFRPLLIHVHLLPAVFWFVLTGRSSQEQQPVWICHGWTAHHDLRRGTVSKSRSVWWKCFLFERLVDLETVPPACWLHEGNTRASVDLRAKYSKIGSRGSGPSISLIAKLREVHLEFLSTPSPHRIKKVLPCGTKKRWKQRLFSSLALALPWNTVLCQRLFIQLL